jgi:hypothetical protein
MEKNLAENSSSEQAMERCTASVLDEEHLTQLTHDGYVGTSFIRESNHIVFERAFS